MTRANLSPGDTVILQSSYGVHGYRYEKVSVERLTSTQIVISSNRDVRYRIHNGRRIGGNGSDRLYLPKEENANGITYDELYNQFVKKGAEDRKRHKYQVFIENNLGKSSTEQLRMAAVALGMQDDEVQS